MDLERISDEEYLYRVVRRSYPDSFIDGQATAALFMDDSGVSVDRDGGRSEKEIIDTFKRRFRKGEYATSVKLLTGECRKIGTYPLPIGFKHNIYHAEIHGSATEKQVSLLKALELAKICKEVI